MIAWLYVFAAMTALDFVWVKYTHTTTNHDAIGASMYASVLILLSGSAAIGYTSDPWLLVPAMAGAFAGTYGAMKLAQRKKKAA